MRILQGSRTLHEPLGPFALAIGIFDGVHRGHQALVSAATDLATADGIESLAFTFHPHPAQVLAPHSAPKLLESIEARLDRLASHGLDAALVEPFDRDFSNTAPEEFVRKVLVESLRARHVIIGDEFSFGHKGAGNVALLQKLGAELGFETHPVSAVSSGGAIISSTRIRELVAAGDVETAAELMGHPYELRGSVGRGDGRGATIGIPTANVTPQNELLPGVGVYAAQVSGTFDWVPAVVNVGYTPTFGASGLKIEAHILDYDGAPLYGAVLSVAFIKKLRGEKKFEGVDALVSQIHRDIDEARVVLGA